MRRCAQCQVDYPDVLEFCPSDGAKLPPLVGETKALYDPLIGSTIDGRYLVEALLGEGGMGMVYAARHAIIDKRVAIKVLRKEAAADEASAQRFLAEAKAASKIGQQNIVDITDFGVLSDGHAYFVMEFLDGPTLGRIMQKEGPIAPARAAVIAQQVCRGLAGAHAKDIIHRDLKPENIFVLEREGVADVVKIVDFGIARDVNAKKRLTVAGMVMGTPEYMAPEQASGQEIDHRADQYALGCILYESLTGQVPFHGENAMQTLTKHVFDALTPPSRARPDLVIPKSLEAVIVRALEKQREARYASMDEMYAALGAILPSLRGIEVPKEARRAPAAVAADASDSVMLASVTRRRTGLFVGSALAVLALGLGGVALFTRDGDAARKAAVTVPSVAAAHAQPVASPTPAPTVTPLPAPPGPARVELKLSSVPSGAQVFLDDELLGTTPISVRRALEATGQVSLLFRKTGFKDTERVVPIAADSYVEVVLPHDAIASRHGPAGRSAPPVAVSASPPPTKTTGARKTEPSEHHNTELRDPFN